MLRCDVTCVESDDGIAADPAMHDGLPPRELPVKSLSGHHRDGCRSLDLHWSQEHGNRIFPTLASGQPRSSLAALLAATRIIGMKVPGEHSVFLQLDLAFAPPAAGNQPFTYRVSEFRKSSQRVAIAIESATCRGTLWGLARPAPVMQPDMAEVKKHVAAQRFSGRRILVVGGSRGLGELAAKILAAGGALVALTYRIGKEDAARVVADIEAHAGHVTAFELDIDGRDWEESLSARCAGFDHLCYFATPPIIDGDGQTLSVPLFQKYSEIYVSGFMRIAQWLARHTGGKFSLFNASSVAAETPPLRNLEYSAAKAASEACCRWLAVACPLARIHIARFPRLITDQTASFLSVAEHDNLGTVLAELSKWLPA